MPWGDARVQKQYTHAFAAKTSRVTHLFYQGMNQFYAAGKAASVRFRTKNMPGLDYASNLGILK
jgi:hypothetical protein